MFATEILIHLPCLKMVAVRMEAATAMIAFLKAAAALFR